MWRVLAVRINKVTLTKRSSAFKNLHYDILRRNQLDHDLAPEKVSVFWSSVFGLGSLAAVLATKGQRPKTKGRFLLWQHTSILLVCSNTHSAFNQTSLIPG